MRKESLEPTKCYQLYVEGLVQGVGFRPFVHRLATEMGIKGTVENNNKGIYISLQASENKVALFQENLKAQKPPASIISNIIVREIPFKNYNAFNIVGSSNTSDEITLVSPDIAVCSDCLHDMKEQKHRIAYPLINCTNCGPRFSIIKALPYDRPHTTMLAFEMCKTCMAEYNNVIDRRFHAQPIACNNCGPKYSFNVSFGENKFQDELQHIAEGIDRGEVYAFKGTGGYNLVCDATNNNAVAKIREIKHREAKPFAVMAADINAAKQIAALSLKEQQLLEIWRRPIVLVKYRGELVAEINKGLSKIGIMLPYMPFHYQLFEKLKTKYLVFTSGNLSSEPIVIDDEIAHNTFSTKVHKVITYNREIYNRVDDSVCQLVNNELQILRRSRGFAPQPFITNMDLEGILAVGAELTNSFCIGKGNQAILSQYIGDLKNAETLEYFEETYERFTKLFRFKPKIIACDMHNDYLSSKFAAELAEKLSIPLLKVQHHHAHIASAMLSNALNKTVIGVSFDGIGLGDDGKVWGAEFMVADLSSYERKIHFKYLPMPGGDKASEETWRMAVSYLYDSFGEDILTMDLPLIKEIGIQKIKQIIVLIKKGINCPLASSAGRLFDAVASIIGVTHFNHYQAEAPMLLESIIDTSEKESYGYELVDGQIDFNVMINSLTQDKLKGIANSILSAKFHNTLVKIIADGCKQLASDYGRMKVILSGGVFQNKYLCEQTIEKLEKEGFEVLLPKEIPINDQGIALGQIAIAANKRILKKSLDT